MPRSARRKGVVLVATAAHACRGELHTVARGNLLLLIQGGVVRVLRRRMSAIRIGWAMSHVIGRLGHWWLREMVAAWTNRFAPDRTSHLEYCRDPGELLGHVFSDGLHRAAAIWTC